MDCAKSYDYILWIQLWENQPQWSINDSWSCILDNPGGDSLQIVINEVLAAIIGQEDRVPLPAPSWKWLSTIVGLQL
jgi:hypothetical protein